MRITLLLFTICLLAPLAAAQDEMEMAAMMEMMAPDEHHESLSMQSGHWTFTSTVWMAPGAPPMESTGTAHYEMGLGGRYLIGVHNGSMMGMPFEGRSITAYDKNEGEYLSTWIDNMGTGIMLFEGEATDDGRLVFEAEYDNPMTGQEEDHRMVQWMDGDDVSMMEYYITPEDGEETLSMRFIYTRAEE